MKIPQNSYAQHGEDVYMLNLLPADVPKSFIDIGANDGRSWSNSYLFGLAGYRLLLIEPMPVYAERCRSLYEGHPNVVIEEVAITQTGDYAVFFENQDAQNDGLAMRSSLIRDMVPSSQIKEIKVRTCSLKSLLLKHAWPTRYAILSVDAEGHDLDVLKTAELSKFRPSIICVEEASFGEDIREYLKTQGYSRQTVLGPNGIYRDDLQSGR